MHYRYIAVENIARKGEIACNKQFLLFLTIFSILYGTYFPFYTLFKMSSAVSFNLDESKILSFGKELKKERVPTMFSTHAENFMPLLSNLEIVVCNLFEFGRVENLSFGKGLNIIST